MSITIKGLKDLDANDYERIIIRQTNDNYQIDVKTSKNKVDKCKTGNKLSDRLKEKIDEEKIILIVESFLRNSKINNIHKNKYFPYYDGKFCSITGTRELYFQLFNKRLKNIPIMVKDKYLNDRLEFCALNSDIIYYNMWCDSNNSSYERVDANYGSGVKFNFITQDGKLAEFEKEFLKNFIEEKLYGIGENATLERKIIDYEDSGPIDFGYFLTCGNLIMRLRSQIIVNEVTEMVNKYNNERDNAKKMQLKMEGI